MYESTKDNHGQRIKLSEIIYPLTKLGFYLFDTIDSIEARQYLITQGKICKNSF